MGLLQILLLLVNTSGSVSSYRFTWHLPLFNPWNAILPSFLMYTVPLNVLLINPKVELLDGKVNVVVAVIEWLL